MADADVNRERRLAIGAERRARTRANILAAAFESFGHEQGLFARIEEIAKAAGVTRPTFYNHFSGMEELREALSHEVTHDFLSAVTRAISAYDDPVLRTVFAMRFYIHRAQEDRRWAWSMVNLSANGIIFGSETYRQAERTVREAMEDGAIHIPSSALGRDIILGGTLAAISATVREDVDPHYAEQVARHIVLGLGADAARADAAADHPLPELDVL